MLPPTKTPNYNVEIALTDGDTLYCTKTISVSWQKPNATDQARVVLTCDCSQHGGGEAAHFDTPTTDAAGTWPASVSHSETINESDQNFHVAITNNNNEQDGTDRSVIVQCPPVIDGAFTLRSEAAGKPIGLESPDAEVVQLRKRHDKVLKGTIDKSYGSKILVMLQKVVNHRNILILAKEVSPTWPWSNHWKVELPHTLWDGDGVLNVRIAFVNRYGTLSQGETFLVKIT
jgi:hypothetical protein